MSDTLAPRAGRPAPDPRATRAGGVGPLAGTATMTRFALRRDRVRLPLWLGGLTLSTAAAVSSLRTNYADPADRAGAAETLRSPAGIAMSGPEHYLDRGYDIGAMTAHQLLGFFALAVGLLAVLTVVRHTRIEEETGRAELVRSGVLGRHAQLAAALLVAGGASLLLGLLLAGALAGYAGDGITLGGALLYGAATAGLGLVFTAVAGVTAQLTPFSRGATGLGLAVVGAAYALRAVGDVGPTAVSWLSPIGWAQRAYPFLDDRWWPLLLHLALAAGAAGAAFWLSTRRDLNAGLRAPRPGPRGAGARLATPLGLATRLGRGTLLGFAAGGLLLGTMLGSILSDAEQMLAEIEEMARHLALDDASVTDVFTSVGLNILAIVALAAVVAALLRARAEETEGRAEPLLATALSRTAWLGGQLAFALGGATLVLLIAGLGLGAAGAVSVGDAALLPELALAALAYAPAVWFTGGCALALYGWFPRAAAAVWAIPGYALAVVFLGEIMDLPGALRDLSPLGHVPTVPAAPLEWPPLLVLTALAAALSALGLLGARRRDLDLR
ncbi:ABC transporter permease [Streptomyces sp. DSM 44915]|uniref:ABC transporter permease n=1 Tax=Streptomyces chisholmiae TaxID=3075540 RepID=A0ABU2JYM2_9ACTN|nr:ABC transporter permease [Streptomyces sp. DSM 44915]MDT0270108.1 ABC transporter permease [Streptomyces sp. DSM 44915]